MSGHRQRAPGGIGLLLIFLTSLFPVTAAASGTSWGDTVSVPPEDAQEEQNAIAFRQIFGLDADLDTVRRAATSPASRRNYGTPLTEAEEAELARRGQVERDSYAAAAFGREQSSWGGYYFDQLAGGMPVFLFTQDTSAMRSRLADLLPPGMAFKVAQVSRTLADLRATKEAIAVSLGEFRVVGIQITSVGLDILGNQVVVGIDGLTDTAERQLGERFGASLRFEEQAPAHSDGCPWTDCRPLKGGIKIVGVPTDMPCTAGYIVRRALDGSLAILSAGHCLWVQNPSDPYGRNWYHVDGGVQDQFGESRFHTFTDPPGSAYTKGDVGLIQLWTSEYPAAANRIRTNLDGGTVHYVSGWIFDDDQTAESQVCAYGYRSNSARCTTIRLMDALKLSEVRTASGSIVSHWIDHTNVYRYNLIGGDSGGPIYKPAFPLSSNVAMMGTHVHSLGNNNDGPAILGEDGWYTPYGWGRLAYIDHAPSGDNYSLCVSASC